MALRAVPDHPKFADLKARIGRPKYVALGCLEAIWHFTGRFTPQGNIGKYPDQAIETWVEWDGEPGELISALIDTHWIDRNEEFRLLVHDWNQHADKATKNALGRSKLPFCTLTVRTESVQSTDENPESGTVYRLPEPEPVPVPVPVPVPEAKAKAPAKVKPLPFAVPDWIPVEAWTAWLEVRKAKRAANTKHALDLAVRKLDKMRADGQSPAAVLDQSTLRSWTGLFPVRSEGPAAVPAAPKQPSSYELAAAAQREERRAAMREAGIQ
jgi:hypothetical protein